MLKQLFTTQLFNGSAKFHPNGLTIGSEITDGHCTCCLLVTVFTTLIDGYSFHLVYQMTDTGPYLPQESVFHFTCNTSNVASYLVSTEKLREWGNA